MAELLKGKPVAEAITERSLKQVEALQAEGIVPCLAIVRVGEKPDDLSYEKGAEKRCAQTGVAVKKVTLPEDISYDAFYQTMDVLNQDPDVHGILMLRPLPKALDNDKARNYIVPTKDVDGCTDGSLSGVFTNSPLGFAPCTPHAVMEILDYYNIDVKGKNVTVIGRSLVVGKPLAMMLLNRHATVTICHTRTKDIASITRQADILVSCTGVMESVHQEYVREGQIVIDVGIGWNEKKGKLCGDVLQEEAEPVVSAITPVPGGVGSVTSSVLVSHVVEAALKTLPQAS